MKTNIKISLGRSTAIVLCVMMFFTACVDLDEDPSESRLDPSALNSVEALEAAIAGSYRALTTAAVWSEYWLNSFGGDDITTHSAKNKLGMREADLRKLTKSSERVATAYNEPYKIIKEVNNIIENENNILGDQNDIDRLIGEAYFLRAYAYFHLVRTYGKIPMILSAKDLTAQIGFSEVSAIYEQIESDLKKAEAKLPFKYPGVPAAYRPNSGSAKAMLAKLYLHWAGWPLKDNAKYASAASKAKEAIDNAAAHGFGLVADMKTLWSIEPENKYNSEIVFGIVHAQELGNAYANRHTGRLGYPGSDAQGWAEIFAEIKFFEDFPAGPRKDATYRTEVVFKGKTIQWQDFKDEAHPMFLKVTGFQDEIATNNSVTSMNTYVMRYADLLLIYAEAEGRAGGNNAAAWEALNKVRRRAAGLPVNVAAPDVDLTSGNLAELAYTERKWELAGEFKRWDDLVRMEKVAEVLPNRSARELVVGSFGDLSPANYFVPIPQSELDVAPWLDK